MKNEFRQRIPNYFDGHTPQTFSFNDTEDLLSNPLLSDIPTYKNFYRFSMSDDALMLELKNGKEWWVLGYIKDPEVIDLPTWEPVIDEELEEI